MNLVLEAQALSERDVPDYIEVDGAKKTAKFTRIPLITDVPYAVQMEPHLVVEYYRADAFRTAPPKISRNPRLGRGFRRIWGWPIIVSQDIGAQHILWAA